MAEYNDMLKRAQGQEENLNNVLAKNAWLNEKGLELEDKFKSLQDAYNHLERKLHDQHQKCKEEKDKLVQQYQAVINHEKGNSKTLRDQVSGLQERNQELQDENAGLRSENGMLRSTNTSLIQTNNSLADDGLERGLQQALENQARDEQMGNADQAPQPNPSSNQGPQPNAFTNQAPQSNPFSNLPRLGPPQTGTASGISSTRPPKRDTEQSDTPDKHPNTKPSNALGRAILTPRSRSPIKNKNTGESEDPGQDILDWCN